MNQVHRVWYDSIINPSEVAHYFDSKKEIIKILKKIKYFNKGNFVYFICTREKVRFNMHKPIEYNINCDIVKIPIIIEDDNQKREVLISIVKNIEEMEIELTEKYITFIIDKIRKVTYSIHDFLSTFNIDLDISNKVEYVGYTKNPEKRPISGVHSGLSDIFYNLLMKESKKDIFIYFNEFTSLLDESIYYFSD
ncbi:hypothetical protein, partial [Neisseria dentiae]|uniref:hypothetical protein n=1 Tax=Neisseria dentiae TaxID=194197 RepID=UPI0035A1C99B